MRAQVLPLSSLRMMLCPIVPTTMVKSFMFSPSPVSRRACPIRMARQTVVGNCYHGELRVREHPTVGFSTRVHAAVQGWQANEREVRKGIDVQVHVATTLTAKLAMAGRFGVEVFDLPFTGGDQVPVNSPIACCLFPIRTARLCR